MSLTIAVAGAAGRMGRALVRAALASDGAFVLTGATARPGSPDLGADAGTLAGEAALGVTVSGSAAAASVSAQIWIDFTTPAAALGALGTLSPCVRAAIIGATGFTADDDARLASAAKRLAIVRSGNFSLGVNLLAALVRGAAAKLGPGWDIEIVEAHHRRKIDAPSGTALMLGEAAAEGRGQSLGDVKLPPRGGVAGPRTEGGIGFSVIRGGGIVGAHEVIFASEREVLTLSHQALDRALFADGALAAARWAADKAPGLYSMRDVLGL